LFAQTEAVAKLGQLYLNKGVWEGQQLLPEGWADTATAFQVSNGTDPDSDWNQGYGFQFWRSRHGFRGDGAFGQFCIVLPEFKAVIAITSGDSNMQRMLNAVWDDLLPGFDRSPASHVDLERRLESLTVQRKINAFEGPNFHGESEEENFQVAVQGSFVTLDFGVTRSLQVGQWTEWEYSFGKSESFPAATIAYWNSPLEFVIRIVNLRTPQSQSFRLVLESDAVSVEVIERGAFDAHPPKSFQAKRS
jgi:hypothetical protein